MIQITSLIFQILSSVMCLLFYKKYRGYQFYIYFLLLTVLTAVIESVGFYFVGTNVNTYFMSYFFIIIQGLFMSLMFKKLIKKEKLVYFLFFFFLISWLFFYNKTNKIHYVIIQGAVNIAIFSFLYLRDLLLSDRVFMYRKLLAFWISVGFLIFYMSSIPFFSMLGYMRTRGLFFLLNILIILMNLFIIYGLITCNKEEKY